MLNRKSIIALLLYLSTNQSSIAQSRYIELEDFSVIDTLYSKKAINGIKQKDFIKGTNMFFSSTYNNNWGVFLIEKKNKFWLVYSFDEYLSNQGISNHVCINKDYVKIYSYRYREFYNENGPNYNAEEISFKFYFLINYKIKKYTSFMCGERVYLYGGKVGNRSLKTDWSQINASHLNIWFKNNNLIIKKVGKSEALMSNGVYKLIN